MQTLRKVHQDSGQRGQNQDTSLGNALLHREHSDSFGLILSAIGVWTWAPENNCGFWMTGPVFLNLFGPHPPTQNLSKLYPVSGTRSVTSKRPRLTLWPDEFLLLIGPGRRLIWQLYALGCVHFKVCSYNTSQAKSGVAEALRAMRAPWLQCASQ